MVQTRIDVTPPNYLYRNVRKIVPELRHSEILSEETGLDVGILDYGVCDGGTHKTTLTGKLMRRLREKGLGIVFAINPCPDKSENTHGSLDDALLLDSARYFPESQVISIIHSDKPYSDIRPIHPGFPNSRKRVEVGIPLDHFVDSEELKDFFQKAMEGKAVEGDRLSGWYTSPEMKKVKDFLLERGLDPLWRNCYVDVTNADDEIAYEYPPFLKELIKKDYTYLVGSIGTGKRFLDQIRNLNREGIVHIGIVPEGHALDPMHDYKEGYSERLNNQYLVNTLKELIRESAGRKDVIFKYVTDKEAQNAETRLGKVIDKEFPDTVTGHSGAVAASVLKSRFEPRENLYFNNKWGILVPRSYQVKKHGKVYGVRRRKLILPYETGVCIVNTGRSSLGMLMQYIAKQNPN